VAGVQILHVQDVWGTVVPDMNVLAISRTSNSVPIGAETPKRGPDHDLSFLLGDRRTYALNLIRDWRQQLEHINGLQKKSIKKTVDEAMRLITFAQVPPLGAEEGAHLRLPGRTLQAHGLGRSVAGDSGRLLQRVALSPKLRP
jgi:hypothetical protein